jgi:hypothetical protein
MESFWTVGVVVSLGTNLVLLSVALGGNNSRVTEVAHATYTKSRPVLVTGLTAIAVTLATGFA